MKARVTSWPVCNKVRRRGSDWIHYGTSTWFICLADLTAIQDKPKHLCLRLSTLIRITYFIIVIEGD